MQAFQHFDPESETATVSQRWKKWKSRFENFLVANNITNNTRKRALLLHHAGERVYDIFETLEGTAESNDYNAAIEKLTEYFSPQKNTEHQILMFRKCYQRQSETLDQFQTRLQMLAKDCEFHDRNNEVKRQIIQACKSSQLRRALEMKPEECTLTKILAIGRRMEAAKRDADEMEAKNNHNISAVTKVHQPSHVKSTNQNKCRNCGDNFPHDGGMKNCKAKTVTCYSCGKQGHYAKYCLKKKN